MPYTDILFTLDVSGTMTEDDNSKSADSDDSFVFTATRDDDAEGTGDTLTTGKDDDAVMFEPVLISSYSTQGSAGDDAYLAEPVLISSYSTGGSPGDDGATAPLDADFLF